MDEYVQTQETLAEQVRQENERGYPNDPLRARLEQKRNVNLNGKTA